MWCPTQLVQTVDRESLPKWWGDHLPEPEDFRRVVDREADVLVREGRALPEYWEVTKYSLYVDCPPYGEYRERRMQVCCLVCLS